MTEKEFRALAGELELSKNEREQLDSKYKTLNNLIRNNLPGNVKVAAFELGGSFAKDTILPGRKELDIVVVLSPKNQHFYYTVLAKANMNQIENCLLYNLFSNKKYEGNDLEKRFIRDYERNTLKIKFDDDIKVDFLVKFNASDLIKTSKNADIENFYLERDQQQLNFIAKAKEEYSLYRNVVKMLKKFRDEKELYSIKSYLLEVLLYDSLSKRKLNNCYMDYFKAVVGGLDRFISGQTIEVTEEMYKYLGTQGEVNTSDKYRVIDVANKSNNVAKHVNATNIEEFKTLRNHINSLIQNNNQKASSNSETKLKLGLYYMKNDNNRFHWEYEIDNEFIKNGGNYSVSSSQDFESGILFGLNNALKYIVNNDYSKIVLLELPNEFKTIFTSGIYKGYDLEPDNNTKRNSILKYIERNKLNIKVK
jgi:hypothetical protein